MDFSTAREKAISIVSKMTIEEKMSQLLYNAAAIDRLGIHEHKGSRKYVAFANKC